MPENTNYTLKVGVSGEKRLSLLNELINPHSLDFIAQVTHLSNKKILEVGCGTGIMALKLARAALPQGSVLATDISNEQLTLAKQLVQKSGLSNIAFRQIDAAHIDQLNQKFDIIYYRFVLGHLTDVLGILRKTMTLMHSHSLLICEEIENVDCMYSEPANPAFHWWQLALREQIKACKGNYTVGMELKNLFKRVNLKTTQTRSVQPIMESSRIKQQLWLGIVEVQAILIASGFTSLEEIEQMVFKLKEFAVDPNSKVGFFSLRQIAAQKDPGSQQLQPISRL